MYWQLTHVMGKLVRTAAQRAADLEDDIKAFMIAIPKVSFLHLAWNRQAC